MTDDNVEYFIDIWGGVDFYPVGNLVDDMAFTDPKIFKKVVESFKEPPPSGKGVDK